MINQATELANGDAVQRESFRKFPYISTLNALWKGRIALR